MHSHPLVILHGWGSNLSRWRTLIVRLRPAVKVILPALPQDQIRNTADFADWLAQKTKSLPSFYLLGHSFGGQIAINFASRYPKRVKKLILIASAGVRRRGWKSRLFLPLAKCLRWLPRPVKVLAYRAIGATDYVKATSLMQATMKRILGEDQQKNMTKIKAPTLILWGKNDRYTPLPDGRLTHELIKHSRLEIVADAKHSLPFTHAALVATKILWFIGLN